MDVGEAVRALKAGKRVAREGWHGKGMWLELTPGQVRPRSSTDPTVAQFYPCVTIRTPTGAMQPGWVCSQPDLLAEDWHVVVDDRG